MFSTFAYFASILGLAAIIFSAALQPLSATPNVRSSISLQTNATSRGPRKSLLSFIPSCDTDLGEDLNPTSCANALSKISQNTGPQIFGLRHQGYCDVVLPARFLSDDGKCAIDINANENSVHDQDVSTFNEISLAAEVIIDECVGYRLPNKGGHVEDLGVYNDLTVAVEQFYPLATCEDAVQLTAPSYHSCKEIIDRMDWSLDETKFGTAGQSGVDVQIPVMMKSTDEHCTAIVYGSEPGLETATWADIWAEIVAVNEMCVRIGKQGEAVVASDPDILKVALMGKGPRNDLNVLSGLNLTTAGLHVLSAANMTTLGFATIGHNRTRPVAGA